MQTTRYLIVGAGVSGLSFANFCGSPDYQIIEADSEVGGYCKTVHRDGFVWDYSGHFFHFKNREMEEYLLARMPADEVRVVEKRTYIRYRDRMMDFPFQKNIHQLPQDEFIECLYDLFFKDAGADAEPTNFKEMLYRKFGRGISEKFLIPYNEKLYACDLGTLDKDAMGRFFPWANIEEIIRNFRQSSNSDSYNATFTYPRGGAIQYVNALLADVDAERLHLNEGLVSIDLQAKVARTTRREIRFEHLITSVPLHKLLPMTGLSYDASALSYNKVLVFNLGFDRKGDSRPHWVYFPEREYCFYRIGYYDNIFDTDRMSLYVELGYAAGEQVDVARARDNVLMDLTRAGVIDGHRLVAEHSIVLDPAYVHITSRSNAMAADLRSQLTAADVHSIGRYGAWTYCSIEDNMLEARALAQSGI